MDTVRFGIIGLGSIGARHAAYINSLQGAKLGAVCDSSATRSEQVGTELGAAHFTNAQEMMTSGTIDAVLIATPHFGHPPLALVAFNAGLHVLCEKPLAVSVKQGLRVVHAAEQHPKLKFGLMFQQRTWPVYAEMKKVLTSGDFQEIIRVSWTITDWFRTWNYYATGGWRATWAGEGGGVLLNQCPHNLDLLWWLTQMFPERITAIARIAVNHPIEVEDEVSAILEYGNGAMGQFTTTTGEAPGTNRLEIATDGGLVIADHDKLIIRKTKHSVRHMRETFPGKTRGVETIDSVQHLPHDAALALRVVTQNFVNAILHNEPLIAPGHEGTHGLGLGNAILMAGLTRQPVFLPMDPDAYDTFLEGLIVKSKYKKPPRPTQDMKSTSR
jgi:predicted dehydrogenase